ncbi:MAG: hypothetical protein DWP95_06505 [Proteobacteria bacterium]|nr:MAG: hypothetical protein DWP95_06505 [Pseudomonadota bacterium]
MTPTNKGPVPFILDQGVPGIHFYTLNRAKATLDVVRALGG